MQLIVFACDALGIQMLKNTIATLNSSMEISTYKCLSWWESISQRLRRELTTGTNTYI